eukprot:TRINITY_DN920_c0_g1_i1.p1 TRINITY_DN920_c0_g1~~TRINITY_DN920_c0_g1_i1.p1  ORF type:complete len:100 (+),score=5.14 TRINITY_DN920_c0_g1_i1:379-678(+)
MQREYNSTVEPPPSRLLEHRRIEWTTFLTKGKTPRGDQNSNQQLVRTGRATPAPLSFSYLSFTILQFSLHQFNTPQITTSNNEHTITDLRRGHIRYFPP